MNCSRHPEIELQVRTWGKSTVRYCPKCHKERVGSQRHKTKMKAITAAGSKCVRCGYDRHPEVLEFHSIFGDPTSKEWRGSWDVLKRELQHCELLCPTCHTEEHLLLGDDSEIALDDSASGT